MRRLVPTSLTLAAITLAAITLTGIACGDPPAAVPATPAPASPVPATPAPATADVQAEPEPKTKPPTKRKRITDAERQTYDFQLAQLDRQLAGRTKIAETNTTSSIAFGNLASLYLSRARLTGDYDDYAKAEQLIDKAFAVSPSGNNGPFMVRARLNYTLHRLDRVDADYELATKLPTRDPSALYQRELFRANLAFQRGQYEQAKKDLDSAVERKPLLPSLASLALYYWKSGQFDQAEPLYLQALEDYRDDATEPAAWLHLQLGLMDLDRGRYDEALEHYRAGEALIKGYWLIEEHIAEILTLQGKTEQAEAMYRAIIERTDNPEFMDALGELLEAAGKTDEATQWYAKAAERYEAQLKRFPEAAYGHALEHFLAHGKDPARALQMAERNHALRPNADAKRLLAQALLAAGKTADARKMIEEALATPMRSADLHAAAAAVYAASGDEAKAQAQREAARAINPKIELE
ncbi:MAG: tetratricopeptide repeat protein [Nannocystaceae bacterium]